jgi:hypothetical protein
MIAAMTDSEIKSYFSQLQYATDERVMPNENKIWYGFFWRGWEDVTFRQRIYKAETLETLTWMNLGYRMAQKFGHQSRDQIYEVFRILDTLKRE